MSEAEKYARDVIDGKVIAGRLMQQAAKRFLSDLERTDIYFDETEANTIIRFAENYCCLWEDKWRGEKVKVMPWMAFIWQQIYGWIRKEDGLRRVRSVYVQIAKKNAKSTIAGITANFHLYADERVNTPKIFVGANNEDQAKICVNITGKIIEQSPDLYSYVEDGKVNLFKYKENIVNIVHVERDGFIKALSKETGDKTSTQSGGKHGINPSMAIIDEYGLAATDDLLNTLESAQAARQEPLLFVITTAGFNRFGPCYATLRDTGIKVLNGQIEDDSYLPFIFEPDEEDKIDDEGSWPKSNPNLGVSVNAEFLRSRIRTAKNQGGSKEVDVKTLNFNTWCDAPSVWISSDTWRANKHGISEDSLLGQTCYAGIYTASKESLNALVLYFPDFNGKHVFKCWTWLCERYKTDNTEHIDYTRWINTGYVKTTPGNDADHKIIEADVLGILPKYTVRVMGYDKTFGTYVIPGIEAAGYQVMPIHQHFSKLSQPTDLISNYATRGIIEHFDNPVFEYHVSATQIHTHHDGKQKPDKSGSGSRIGVVSAALNAMVAKDEYIKIYGELDLTFFSLK